MTRLAVIGAGMMGEALTAGLLANGWPAGDIVLADVRSDHVAAVAERLGVSAATGNAEAVADADAVLVAVKPQDAAPAFAEAGAALGGGALLSIVAGMRIDAIAGTAGAGAEIVRAMPNTPARVGKGVTALAAGPSVGDDTRAVADRVFSAVGPVVWVPERYLDAVTALSGSGPAYLFLVAEAMVDAGVALGLPRDVACTLAYSTIEGAGAMLVLTGEHPATLRSQVTSPGGTTAAALGVLEQRAVRAAFLEAICAAHARSVELGG